MRVTHLHTSKLHTFQTENELSPCPEAAKGYAPPKQGRGKHRVHETGDTNAVKEFPGLIMTDDPRMRVMYQGIEVN